MSESMKKSVTVLIIMLSFALLWPLQEQLLRLKDTSNLSAASPFTGRNPGEFVGTVLLGGFRNIVIDITWLKAIKLSEEREYYKLLAAYKTIANLQPNIALVWEFNGHNMAYNISCQSISFDEKVSWIRRATDFIREGIEKNPRTFRLYDFLASVYYYKIGREDDIKAEFLRNGENPYLEALKYWRLASAQQDVKATVYTQQIHCLIKLWRFDEARRINLEVLHRWPNWEPGGIVYYNRFDDAGYDGSVPYLRNIRLFRTWKEMN